MGNHRLRREGAFHRLDGPAVIWNDNMDNGIENFTKNQWWIHGFPVDDLIKPWAEGMNIDLDNLSEEDKIIITIVWSDYKI